MASVRPAREGDILRLTEVAQGYSEASRVGEILPCGTREESIVFERFFAAGAAP